MQPLPLLKKGACDLLDDNPADTFAGLLGLPNIEDLTYSVMQQEYTERRAAFDMMYEDVIVVEK